MKRIVALFISGVAQDAGYAVGSPRLVAWAKNFRFEYVVRYML